MEVLKKIIGGIDAISEFTGRAVAWLTLVVVIIAAFNAITRYVAAINKDIVVLGITIRYNWIEPIIEQVRKIPFNTLIESQWYLFAIIFLLGGAYTLKHGSHVRVDVLYDRFSPKVRAWVNLVGHVLFLVPFCIFMIWATKTQVFNSWAELEGSPDPGGLPRYPIKTVLPVAFLLLLIQGIGEILKQIQQLLDPAKVEPEPEEEVHV